MRTFCEEHREERRSELRRVVVETLKQKNSESRQKIGDLVEKLSRDGQVRKVEHFWIVNGFACDATGDEQVGCVKRTERFSCKVRCTHPTRLVIGPQGNSFSGPHAAGVAALMLSANSPRGR